ncbi:MAG: histidine--tRNA ligase [Clostridia bacterium]|nr:histidine--tRNA ligase [Clostridia bacterium]
MENIRKPRGTMDIMAPDIYKWQFVEKKLKSVAARFGFSEIRTPTFEELSLFQRGVGEGTDVVQKEMYTLEDKEGKVFALRPEGTASVVRALIENGRCGDTYPIKLNYLINCFRYEKPQAGRSREFFQFGTEVFGSADAGADFTVISLAHTALTELGVKGIKLHINSIGCPECRPKYREALVSYLKSRESELCETCRTRMENNPLRVLDCKNDSCRAVAAEAPKTLDYLCDECRAHQDKLCAMLDAAGIDYVADPHIVRGLDYYTKTVFEFIAEGIGAQSTVCGGGRYDGLVKELGGPSLPACGFGMGITRLLLALEESGVEIPAPEAPRLYVASLGDAAQLKASSIVLDLRRNGVYAEYDTVGRSLKAQMKYADKIGAAKVLILGDSELETGRAVLRTMTGNMGENTQTEIDIANIADLI